MNQLNPSAFQRSNPLPPHDSGPDRSRTRALRTSPTLSVHELRRIVAEMVG